MGWRSTWSRGGTPSSRTRCERGYLRSSGGAGSAAAVATPGARGLGAGLLSRRRSLFRVAEAAVGLVVYCILILA